MVLKAKYWRRQTQSDQGQLEDGTDLKCIVFKQNLDTKRARLSANKAQKSGY